MPTAAAKLEKQPSTEAADPLKMAMIVLEHKIRNLEKRKRKIEIYREDQSKGQTLNSDQLSAVSKYDEVTKTLDFAQELYKQFQGIATETSKVAKKQLRKEALERATQEVYKVKDVLMVQDILQGMGQENVREDFLSGKKNAVKLLDQDLKYLDDLYLEVAPKRSAPEDGLPPFVDQLSAAAEHLISIVEGKQKEVVGTTHEYLKQLFTKIQDCGYFDQAVVQEVPAEANQLTAEVIHEELQVVEPEVQAVAVEVKEKQFSQALLPAAPLANSLPIPSSLVPQSAPPAPEPAYFATAATTTTTTTTTTTSQAPDYNSLVLDQQQTVNELINTVGGSFNFLQESELDAPGVDSVVIGAASPGALLVSTIPSQTYTSQNFPAVATAAPSLVPTPAALPPPQTVGYQVPVSDLSQTIPGFATTTPNPPPPIPMPPSHRSHPYAAVQAPPANAYQPRPEYHQEQQAAGDTREGLHGIHVDSWALSESAISAGNVAAEWSQHGTGQQPEWNADTNQTEWALAGDDNQGQGRVGSASRRGGGGGRGGAPRGAGTGSPTAYNASRTQGRPGNFHNGNRNNSSYGNYPRNQEGHPPAGVSNQSYYQQQNGYQQQPHAQHAGQREQFASNGNYAAYRARPAHRAPGTRGSSRGGMSGDGANANANANASNPRAARGTAFVGGRPHPHMNRQ